MHSILEKKRLSFYVFDLSCLKVGKFLLIFGTQNPEEIWRKCI